MSIFDKAVSTVTKAVTKAYDGTIGDIINPSNAIVRGVTGLSNTNQAMIGGTVGTATFLNGLLNTGGLGASANGGQGSSIWNALFGSNGSSSGFLGDILGSVVKGAVGIGADYFSSQQYYKDQRKLNEQKFGYDRQLADEAYQRDVAMWNMQNAYNAPAQQMERLKKAGLNPNLVYGSGSVTGNTAGSPPSYLQVQYPSSSANKLDLARNILGIFNEYQSIRNQALQNQRENARIALQARALDLSEEREKNRDKQAQRQFDIMMANFGLALRKQDNIENSPKSWIGRNYSDIKDVAQDVEEGLQTYGTSLMEHIAGYIPKPNLRGLFRRNKYPWEK